MRYRNHAGVLDVHLPILSSISENELPSAPERPTSSALSFGLDHRELVSGEFWRKIPAFRDVDEAQFLDHRWQLKHSLTKVESLVTVLADLVDLSFARDVEEGLRRVPMAVRITPYILSLIDWENPREDPLRRQFIPLASTSLPDHPRLTLDSLHEQKDSPVEGLTHRYPDKALFLALDTCPVYCRFCTRSYAVGPDQESVEKLSLKATQGRWNRVFEYLRSRPEIEDVVISGGDVWNLRSDQVQTIGESLLAIPHIRRMRFASKGLAVMPQKILSDEAWFQTLVGIVKQGRRLHKDVVLHTHFNHPNEITSHTQAALGRLHEEGVTVRNQCVLQRGVNDRLETMVKLTRRLSYINVHPYYVYVHDLVRGTEELRTTVQEAVDLEKGLRGLTAGFNTPTFVVDAPGGGGKRDVHSLEHYDRTTGVSVYAAPSVRPGSYFLYFDPIDRLPEEGKQRWARREEHDRICEEAIEAARAKNSSR